MLPHLIDINIPLALHVYSVVLGLGGATYTDILVFHFMKDKKISPKEQQTLHFLGKMMWISIALLLLTGLILVFGNMEAYMQSTKFLSKAVIFVILVVNGFCFHKWFLPHMDKLSNPHKGKALRRRGAVMAVISVTSWYSIFVLGMARSVALGIPVILTIYGTILVLGVITVLLLEAILFQKQVDSSN